MTPLVATRTNAKISRRQVSTDLVIEYSHLFRIETGEAQASPALARRLCEYFAGRITRDQILYPDLYVVEGAKNTIRPIKKPNAAVRAPRQRQVA